MSGDEQKRLSADPSAETVAADAAKGDGLTQTSDASQTYVRGAGTELARGDVLGRYTILEVLGSGGMGVVYSAYDPDLDRRVALKLLRSSSQSSAARGRLLREARAMAKLSHPNVITVYEVGTVGARDFVAMEHVAGGSLDQWLAEEERDPDLVLDMYLRAGRGLAAAHEAGLVHRDFKPANVLVKGETALVTDFGLARTSGETVDLGETLSDIADKGADLNLTKTGAVMGTPAYMSPEQHRGEAATERSDQFSFCVALWEGIFGARPFAGANVAELISNIAQGNISSTGNANPRVRRTLVRGMSQDPADRYGSMNELLARLAAEPVSHSKWATRGAVVFAGLIAGGAFLFMSNRGQAPVAQRCDDGPTRVAPAWDDDVRRRVGQAFASAGPTGGLTFARFDAVAKEYRSKWIAAYASSCKATFHDKTQSESEHALRVSCLQSRRDALIAMSDAFATPSARGLELAVQAAETLPSIEACASRDAARGLAAPPSEVADEVKEVRALIADVSALIDAARSDDALEKAKDMVARARKLTSYRFVLVEALHTSARACVASNKAKAAEEANSEALLLAEELDYEEYQARIKVHQVKVSARFSSDRQATLRLGRLAAAAVKRYGKDDSLQASLNRNMAAVHAEVGDLDSALKLLSEAEGILSRVRGPDSHAVADVVRSAGEYYAQRGDLQKSVAEFRRALAIYRETALPTHPVYVYLVDRLSDALRTVGEFDEAQKLSAESRSLWQSDEAQRRLRENKDAPEGEVHTLRGTVVDEDGSPVVGATVVAGMAPLADGKFVLGHAGGTHMAFGLDHALTDSSGAFTLRPRMNKEKPTYVVAEKDGIGRSFPSEQTIYRGTKDVDGVRLVLKGFGRLSGQVRGAGDYGVQVLLTPQGTDPLMASGVGAAVLASVEGRYSFERLAPGKYDAYMIRFRTFGFGGGRDMRIKQVTVRPGTTATLDLAFESTAAGLSITVIDSNGKPARSSQVFLIEGEVKAKNGKELLQALISREAKQRRHYSGFYREGEALRLDAVAPGKYSSCIVPLDGDLKDPEFIRAINAMSDDLAVYCQPQTVAKGKEQQTLEIRAPTLNRVPPK